MAAMSHELVFKTASNRLNTMTDKMNRRDFTKATGAAAAIAATGLSIESSQAKVKNAVVKEEQMKIRVDTE